VIINKTSNHLSPKESLNSDGQHFHQYQQNKQSPLTIYLLCYNIVGKGSQAPLAEHETDGMDQQQDETFFRSEVSACFIDIGGTVDHHCLEVIVCFIDIGGTVDHHCLKFK
jgi:hypothetical protein